MKTRNNYKHADRIASLLRDVYASARVCKWTHRQILNALPCYYQHPLLAGLGAECRGYLHGLHEGLRAEVEHAVVHGIVCPLTGNVHKGWSDLPHASRELIRSLYGICDASYGGAYWPDRDGNPRPDAPYSVRTLQGEA